MNDSFNSLDFKANLTTTIEQYRQLIKLNPERAELHADLGSLYARQQNWQKAIAAYQQAIKLNPDFAGAYRNLARVLTQTGNQSKAVERWYQALQLEPNWAKAEKHYLLGNTLITHQKIGKAAQCYRQAIKLKPDFLAAYQRLGEILASQGKYRQLITLFRQGVKFNPDNPQFHFGLGNILAAQQQWEQAGAQYRKTIELNQNFAVAYYSWGVVLTQQQKWQKASDNYQKAIALQPNYWEAYHQLGNVLNQLQQWQEAIAAYQNVAQINPSFVPVYLQLGKIFCHLEDYQSALNSYQTALEYTTQSSTLEQQAVALCQEAIAQIPKPTAKDYYQLAKFFRAKSHFKAAIITYQQALKINPRFQSAYIDLQYTPTDPQLLEELIPFYQNIVSEHPNLDVAWGNLGDALSEQGRISEAIDSYRSSSYQRVIKIYPSLASFDWQHKKEQGPNFIIAGAAKGGTSSLYNYLSHHPQILLPHKKELDFFWKHYQKGTDWYLAHFPSISDQPDYLTGEATPNYIRFPVVAERIYQSFPQVKLIFLLRNPVERTISWHYHKVNHGQINSSLTDAIALELKQLENQDVAKLAQAGYRNPDNILGSLYFYQLQPWLELFNREQLLILPSEDLYNNPAQVMEQVFSFLDLPNHPISNYLKVNAGSYQNSDSQLKSTLTNYFQAHNRQLEEHLGIKFNWD
ncbi:sulfotransferase [Stanieria cyanosphaera PCC 7437]|uniref:Sulfotransferase n=1 Tax=Stanieria cyanosphaera (strain ATCC 29371 / PCC 7437) TaxID=111780 RepID=K9XT64_STAC7|nr:tetratricopeptide repeat protein [Stanieria cyanosphaera]AFZ35723.1 sulfotransferase [Stanieria cyanosphaera PCC 7437]